MKQWGELLLLSEKKPTERFKKVFNEYFWSKTMIIKLDIKDAMTCLEKMVRQIILFKFSDCHEAREQLRFGSLDLLNINNHEI